MKTIRLGKTGLQVSRVGLGGIPLQRLAEAEAIRVVRRCVELGVTFIDTANGYTTSEAYIGKALMEIGDANQPPILATKTAARDAETALAHLEQSLYHLGVESIDLWQMHNVSSIEDYERVLGPGGALETAKRALDAGQIRHIGITSHSLEMALEAVDSGYFETIQFPFNFVTSEAAERLVPLARENDVGFIAMKPFAGGLLDDAPLAIKYLLQFENVLPDPGIEKIEEIEEIAAILDGSWELDAVEKRQIERIRAEADTRFCRRCGYCEPCEQGVRISLVMNVPSFLKRFPREHFAGGELATGIQTGRQCIECGECEGRCPYNLPIREMIAEYMELYEQALQAV